MLPSEGCWLNARVMPSACIAKALKFFDKKLKVKTVHAKGMEVRKRGMGHILWIFSSISYDLVCICMSLHQLGKIGVTFA